MHRALGSNLVPGGVVVTGLTTLKNTGRGLELGEGGRPVDIWVYSFEGPDRL